MNGKRHEHVGTESAIFFPPSCNRRIHLRIRQDASADLNVRGGTKKSSYVLAIGGETLYPNKELTCALPWLPAFLEDLKRAELICN